MWLRLLDDHILTPAKFYSLSAEDCQKRVQFVPVPYDNKYIGERLQQLQGIGEEELEDVPLNQRVSVVDQDDDSMNFFIFDSKRNQYVSTAFALEDHTLYGPPGDARRECLVFRTYPKDLFEEEDSNPADMHESPRILELDMPIVAQIRRRIYEWPPPQIPPTRALIDAVEALDHMRIREVLESDGPFNIPNSLFVTALIKPLSYGRTNTMAVKELLDAGVDDLASPVESELWKSQGITPGATPFFVACSMGRLDCALLIIEKERAIGRTKTKAGEEKRLRRGGRRERAQARTGRSPAVEACQS